MNPKIFVAALLLFVLMMTPFASADAWDSAALSALPHPAVAWLEADVLFVALSNASGSRERFWIEPVPANRSSYSPFGVQSPVLPGYTVQIESIRLSPNWDPRWDGELTEIMIESDRGRRSFIPVQRLDGPMRPNYFVLRADHQLEVTVDLGLLLEGHPLHRLMLDHDYRVFGSNQRGRITVTGFDGGFVLSSQRNEVSYQQPRMILTMRTPLMWETGLLSFTLTHTDAAGRRETFSAPLVLVIGSGYRLIDNTFAATTRTVR